MPPTSSFAARAIRSAWRMISAGGCARATRRPLFGASSAHAPRISSSPPVVWQASAGRGVHLDGVQKASPERLDPRDVAVAKRRGLLDERGSVDAELDASCTDGIGQRPSRVVAHDAGAAPADVRLDEHRESQVRRRIRCQPGIVDDARARMGEPE
jgi:hypothetical protein